MSHELRDFVTTLQENDKKRTAARNQGENARPGEFITVAEAESTEADISLDERMRSLRQQLSRVNGLAGRIDNPEGLEHFEGEALRLLLRLQGLYQSAANLYGYGGNANE